MTGKSNTQLNHSYTIHYLHLSKGAILEILSSLFTKCIYINQQFLLNVSNLYAPQIFTLVYHFSHCVTYRLPPPNSFLFVILCKVLFPGALYSVYAYLGHWTSSLLPCSECFFWFLHYGTFWTEWISVCQWSKLSVAVYFLTSSIWLLGGCFNRRFREMEKNNVLLN